MVQEGEKEYLTSVPLVNINSKIVNQDYILYKQLVFHALYVFNLDADLCSFY